MWPFDAIARPDMIDAMHLARIGVNPAHRIAQHGVVLPRSFPQLVHHLQVFIGPGVALLAREQGFLTEVARRVRQIGSDNIPRHAAIGKMVKGRGAAREIEGMLLIDRTGIGEAQMPGSARHGRDQQRGIIARDLQRLADGEIGIGAVGLVHPDHIGQEQRVETTPFQDLGQFHPRIERGVLELTSLGMTPLTVLNVRHAVHGEGIENQRLAHRILSRRPQQHGELRLHSPFRVRG